MGIPISTDPGQPVGEALTEARSRSAPAVLGLGPAGATDAGR